MLAQRLLSIFSKNSAIVGGGITIVQKNFLYTIFDILTPYCNVAMVFNYWTNCEEIDSGTLGENRETA